MNKTITQFVFAAALLVAMLASTGIAHAQSVTYADGQTAIRADSFSIRTSGTQTSVNFFPLKTGTYTVVAGGQTKNVTVTADDAGDEASIVFTLGDAVVGDAVLSFGSVEVARQRIGTPPPTISLRGPFAGNAQRITRIREIDFVIADDFNGGRQPVIDYWELSINGGTNYDFTKVITPFRRPNIAFTLPEGRYDDDQVRVRQSIDQVLSPFAGLDAFIFDSTPPDITLKGDARIVLQVGDTYDDMGATVTDNLDTDIQSRLMVDSSAVDTSTAGTYTVRYSATDHTEHGANTGRATREVVVQGQLAFAVGGAPMLTSDGATVGGVTFAKAGDILTLAFTTNLALASTPTVTIFVGSSGRGARVTKGAGNAYSATYTVAAAHFPDSDGVAARYHIDTMVAADDASNTFNPPGVTSAILVDVVSPVVTFPEIVGRGVVGDEQSHSITFSEAVTATVASFSSSTGLMVDRVSGSGSDTLTVAYTPKAESFTLAVNLRGVTDRAGNRGPSSRTSRGGFADPAVLGPAPGIALERDTAADGAVNTDRLTRNRGIVVTLASDFDTNRDTWEYSINGGTTDYLPGTGTSFSLLPAGSAAYSADQVRARQTVDGVVSAFAGLDAFIIDIDPPTANLGSIAGAVIDRAGQTHDITFSENVAGLAAGDFSASTGITVTAVSGSDGGTDYTLTYTATAAAFTLLLSAGSVTDIAGNLVVETSLAGTATAPVNQRPTANAGPDQPNAVVNREVTLSGSGDDPDGDNSALIYFWGQASGPDVDLSNDGVARPTFTPAKAGIYTFDLTVIDDGGVARGTTDRVIITVSAATTDTTAPVITFDRFTHTGGVEVGTTVFFNVGDTLTAFVNSDEALAATSLEDAAFFDFDGSVRPVQDLLPVVGVANQYSATYTIKPEDNDAGPQFNVRGVTDTADPVNPAPNFRHPVGAVTIDTSVPVIALEGTSPVTVAHGGTYTEAEDAGISGASRGDTTAMTTTGPDAMAVNGIAVDTDTAGDYLITYIVTDRAGNVSNTLTRTVTVGAAPVANTAPVVSGNTAPNYAENADVATLPVATYAATDAESNAFAWSVAGADANLFAIDADGVLTFKASPNFEDAADADGGNTYEITIIATETDGNPSNLPSAPLMVTVTVTNVDEAGTVIISGTAQVGVELTASVTDPDGAVTDALYQWRSSGAGGGVVSGDPRVSATYQPVAADVGRTLSVTVVYSDPVPGGKNITSAPTAAVIAAPDTTAPMVTIPALGESTAGNTASVKITFDEAVTGLTSGDFTADNATVNSVSPDSGSDTTYLVTYTPGAAGAVRLTLTADSVSDTASPTPNTGPASPVTATGTAAAEATEDTTKPRITATMTIAGLTTAEFDADEFRMGIARLLNVRSSDVTILSITAASVIVEYEVVTTADQLAALAATLSGASASQLRTASGQTLPGTAVVTNTEAQTRQPPVAHAGFDQRNVDTGATVTLDGSRSTGDDLTYEWTVPTALGGTINLSSTTAVQPTFTAPPQANDLMFTLTVTDNDGVTATDTVTIFVTPADSFRIALADDTGIDGDGITSNGVVNVMNLPSGGTWTYSTNGGTSSTPGSGTSFDLDEGVYDADDVVATLAGVGEGEDETVELGPVTVDSTPLTVVTFGAIAAGVIGTPQEHDIIFAEAEDFDRTDITAAGATVNRVTSNDGITHTINFTPNAADFSLTLAMDSVVDVAGNSGPAAAAVASGTATEALAFTVGEEPTLTSDNSINSNYARDGDTLTLAFTLNQAVAALPAVTIAGGTATVTKGAGNDYTATYTVVANDVTDNTLVGYNIDAMAAADNLANTLAATDGSTDIRIDVTAPTVTLGAITAGVIDTEQTHDITFSEAVTGLAVGDFSVSNNIVASGDLVVNSVTPASGPSTTYTISITPRATAFTLVLAAGQVADVAGNAGPAVEASASGTATEPPNQPPVADAGDNQDVKTGVSVTLNGSRSSDTDGTIESYAWAHTQTDGATPAPAVNLTGANPASPTFTAPATAGTLVFTLTVTDDDGASHTDTVTITVSESMDTTTPVITLLGDSPLEVDQGATYTDPGATARDGGGGPLTGIVVGGDTVETDMVGEYIVTYNVFDNDGNAARTVARIVRVVEPDTVPPVITLLGDSPLEVDQGATYTDPGATASDDRDDDLSAGIVVGGDTVEIDTVGEYTVTYDVSDAAGNAAEQVTRIVRVVLLDTVPPVITLLGDSPLEVDQGATYTDPGATAGDDRDGDLSNRIVVGGDTVETDTVGEYTVTYDVSDAAGNAAEQVTRIVRVVLPDTVAPVITLLGDSPLEVDQGATYTDPGATASDDRDGDLSAGIVVGGDTVETDTVGEYAVTYDVSDAAGNAAEQATRIVRVVLPPDTVAPVITLLGDSPLEVGQRAAYTDPGATASDDRDGDISAGIVVGGDTVETDTAGEYAVTYDVSDAAGNAAEQVTRIVRVVVVRDLDALNRAILPEVARDIADQNVSAIARRLEQARLPSRAAGSASLGGASSLAEIANSQGRSIADDRFDMKRLLGNSDFVLPLSAAGEGEADDTQLTLWGAGDYRNLKGADGVRWDGDLFSLRMGLDVHLNENTIVGVSISGSQAKLDYTNPSMATSGDYDLDMASVHPYLGWAAGSMDFWATAGYGKGELEISEDGAQTDIPSSDLSMQTLALGANGVLMETNTTTLLLKTEALSTELEVDASEGITALTQKAHRVRMTLEAIRGFSLDSGARLETSLEAGLRYDGGDGTTGTGAEIGGGLRYAGLGERLVMEGKARALVGGKGDAEEWGLSGLIKLSPSANGRGLSFSLAPGYGATASGVERLWQQGLDDGLGAQGGQGGNNYSPNLDIRLDYGMDVPGRPGLMTPYTEFSLGDRNTYRLGLQWRHSKWFDLKLVGEREESGTTAEHRIYLKGEIAF